MRIAVAADHAGFEVKDEVVRFLRELGHEVQDLGGDGTDLSDDYPDYAVLVGDALRSGAAERGVLVCGSGVGVSIAANKMPGIRAAICHDHYSAHQGVEHDDMNVLVLGGRIIGGQTAKELVRAFVDARFSGEERHVRRLGKVQAIEDRYSAG